jgi:hypothetical protein
MFAELTHSLAISSSTDESQRGLLPDGCFMLISDTLMADGSFVLHHFIHSYLKCGYGVSLVAFEQSYFHYQNIGRKLVSNKHIIQGNVINYCRV